MSRQAMWLEAIERRINATTAMLGAMKSVKMCGLTETLSSNLHNLRLEEIRISKKFRRLLIWNLGFAYFSPVVAPILTFTVFSVLARNKDGDTTLDTTRVFTALSLFALLTDPLATLIMSISTFAGSKGCFDRIQAFLQSDERVDGREMQMELHTNTDYHSSKSLLISEKHAASSEQMTSPSASDTYSEKAKPRSEIARAYDPLPNDTAIAIHDGNFGWDKEKDPILHAIDIMIPKEKLTLLVGSVGCGKSTLLKAILGEVPLAQGVVQISSPSVAYCDQSPWHTSSTIKQTITAFSDFDAQWYDTVIRACALEDDLRQLPRQDQTIVGSKGISLSGGQSQRLALARAVYCRKPIVILDDVLSGLDAGTESKVFHNLMGQQGLLRQLRATVLVASSSVKRLPDADHIIAINGEGKVSEQGSFEQLKLTGGYTSMFGLSSNAPKTNPEDDTQKLSKTDTSKGATQQDALPELPVADDDASRRTGDTSVYIYYIQAIGWVPTIIFFACISCYVFGIAFPNIWVKWWAQANATAPNENLGYWLGIYGLLGAVALICLIVSCWQLIITMVPKSAENFHWMLLRTVLSAPMSFFATTDTGVTINRFSQDLQLIDMDLPISALNCAATFIICLAQMILIGVASTYAAISFPFIIVVLYFLQQFYLRTSRQLRFLDLEAKSPLYSQFVECLNGLVTVRAFGWQTALEKKSCSQLDYSQRPFYLLYAIQRCLTLVLDLVVAAIAVLLFVLVVELRGKLNAGFVGVALVNVILFSQYLKLLLTYWTMLETHIGALARIKTFTHDTKSEHLPIEDKTPPPEWPSSGGIEFKSVSASYNANDMVLKDVSLSIEGGQKVGICGRTGSGKSSLIASLFRMIELSQGTITVDGLDISTIPRQEIRSRLIGVPQDTFLMVGSVRFNIDSNNIASDKDVIEALKSVQLWDIVEGKGGLATNIDELHLSHGQRQLFCLARAMLRPSTILVLDEATSSVDPKTDALMQRVIRQKFAHHTIIAVAHRLETIMDFDRIAVLDQGSLLEYDQPHVLLGRDSRYKALYESSKSS
ncbi:MAG: hypothetical protein M1820_003259 [Bogoriella megaspora]|nr:MAG: hypothetical protein M1820_003259 [Bogoriella megaspora]